MTLLARCWKVLWIILILTSVLRMVKLSVPIRQLYFLMKLPGHLVFVPPRSSSRMELPWTYSCHFNRCQRQCLLAALWLITNSLSSISLVQITLRNVSHKMLMNYGNVPVADGISKINVHNAKQIENLFFLLTM